MFWQLKNVVWKTFSNWLSHYGLQTPSYDRNNENIQVYKFDTPLKTKKKIIRISPDHSLFALKCETDNAFYVMIEKA